MQMSQMELPQRGQTAARGAQTHHLRMLPLHPESLQLLREHSPTHLQVNVRVRVPKALLLQLYIFVMWSLQRGATAEQCCPCNFWQAYLHSGQT